MGVGADRREGSLGTPTPPRDPPWGANVEGGGVVCLITFLVTVTVACQEGCGFRVESVGGKVGWGVGNRLSMDMGVRGWWQWPACACVRGVEGDGIGNACRMEGATFATHERVPSTWAGH